jgi:glycosyltransferase involved in cell wall biosynthesis
VAAVCRRDLDAIGGPPERHLVVPVAAAGPTEVSAQARDPVVVLTGNLGYRPTRDSARWFADAVWPGVLERAPGARWVVAGARPPREVQQLGRRPGVDIRGDVPVLADVLSHARVSIAPMASGSGIPMKVIEAWAAGVPVVATPRAVESLEGGPDACELRSRDDVAGWTESIVRLLTDPERASELSRRGRRAWQSVYAPEAVSRAVRHAVASTVAWRGGSR